MENTLNNSTDKVKAVITPSGAIPNKQKTHLNYKTLEFLPKQDQERCLQIRSQKPKILETLLRLTFPVIPMGLEVTEKNGKIVKVRPHRPLVKWKEGQCESTADKSKIDGWCEQFGDKIITWGVVCKKVGLVVIDFDEELKEIFKPSLKEGGYHQNSYSRGKHFFFKQQDNKQRIKKTNLRDYEGQHKIDIIGDNGIIPFYEDCLKGLESFDDLKPLPKIFIEILSKRLKKKYGGTGKLLSIPGPGRNNSNIPRMGWKVIKGELTIEEAENRFRENNIGNPELGKHIQDLRKFVEDNTLKYEGKEYYKILQPYVTCMFQDMGKQLVKEVLSQDSFLIDNKTNKIRKWDRNDLDFLYGYKEISCLKKFPCHKKKSLNFLGNKKSFSKEEMKTILRFYQERLTPQWLESFPDWDKVDRIGEVLNPVECENFYNEEPAFLFTFLIKFILKKMWTTIKTEDQVPIVILNGPKGIGKDALIEVLLSGLGHYYTRTPARDMDSKDMTRIRRGKLAVHWEEAIAPEGVSELEEMCVRSTDFVRKYEEASTQEKLYSIIIGSSNEFRYKDHSGTRKLIICNFKDKAVPKETLDFIWEKLGRHERYPNCKRDEEYLKQIISQARDEDLPENTLITLLGLINTEQEQNKPDDPLIMAANDLEEYILNWAEQKKVDFVPNITLINIKNSLSQQHKIPQKLIVSHIRKTSSSITPGQKKVNQRVSKGWKIIRKAQTSVTW